MSETEQNGRTVKIDSFKWYVVKTNRASIPYREKLRKHGFTIFLPTRYEVQMVGGRRVRVERPVIFNYIFVRTSLEALKEFCKLNSDIHILYRARYHQEDRNNEENRVIVIPDEEMKMFAKAVGMYEQDVPFVKPTEVELSKGDHVRITEGPFAGIEGVLMSQQGKDGGRVLVNVGNLLTVPTLDIKPEYLQIISFAPNGKHMYKKFDSFVKKARTAMRQYYKDDINAKQMSTLLTFLKRFSELKTHTVNSHLKLLVYKLICYTCLKADKESAGMEQDLVALLPEVNSSTSRAFALVHLFGCTRKATYRDEVEAIVAEWGSVNDKEKTKQEIIEDLLFYNGRK